MSAEPLNPKLYQALVRRFGHVEIANQGETGFWYRRPAIHNPGILEKRLVHSGEYYRVSCCHCSDTRKRLWINYQFGVRDPETDDDHLYLINCFNEGCFDTRQRQEALYERLLPFNYNARMRICDLSAAASKSDPATVVSVPATLPASVIPLMDPACARARDYLLSRGFDPLEISERWEVGFCFYADLGRFGIRDRLIIPIETLTPTLDRGPVRSLAGWQARNLYDVGSDKPKYLTMPGMRKSHVLYGLVEAISTTGPILVVEGATDVWRVGENAVATLGKSLSDAQIQLLLRHFVGRPLGVMYDSDASLESRCTADRIRASRREWRDDAPVVDIPVPAGRKDAGECSRNELWAAIGRALLGGPSAAVQGSNA